jgi:hypothetical protein
MDTRIVGLTISAIILAYGTVGAVAQDQLHPDQQQVQSQPMKQEGGHEAMMGHGMMRAGMKGPPEAMMRIMFALIDTDSDGTVSLQEFQAAHERIFKAMDANKDGKLTFEEMQTFIHGTR